MGVKPIAAIMYTNDLNCGGMCLLSFTRCVFSEFGHGFETKGQKEAIATVNHHEILVFAPMTDHHQHDPDKILSIICHLEALFISYLLKTDRQRY